MRYSVSFTVTRLVRFLLLFSVFLLIANLIAVYFRRVLHFENAFGFVALFDFDNEYNVPSLFSVLLIATNALLLLLISRHKAVVESGRKYWRIFSYVFFYLALDELASIHEQLGHLVYRFSPHLLPTDVSRYWIVPMGILVALFAVYFFRFYWQLPGSVKLQFFVAGSIYVLGAVGVELLGELYMWNHREAGFGYGLLSSLEEMCEMIGMILFLRALLLYLQELSKSSGFQLQFSTGQKQPE